MQPKYFLLLLSACFLAARTCAQPSPRITSIIAQISTDSLVKNVAELSGTMPVFINGQQDTIKTRFFNQPSNEKAFCYLRQRFARLGLAVDSQVFSMRGKNLFGTIKGIDTSKMILVGAHYDGQGYSVGQATDDNASGVAAVLECARLCVGKSFTCNLMFALWDEEETGSTGSNAFVSSGFMGTKWLLGSINLDMIGWDGNGDSVAEIHTSNIDSSPAWAARAEAINTDYSLGLQTEIINPGSNLTDAASFWGAYLPAIGIYEDCSSDFNPYWHTANDTVGNLNKPYFTKLTKLALGTVLSYALVAPTLVGTSPSQVVPRIVPNPFGDLLRIENVQADATVTVVDERGSQVLTAKSDGRPLTLSTPHLPAGAYTVIIQSHSQEQLSISVIKAQ